MPMLLNDQIVQLLAKHGGYELSTEKLATLPLDPAADRTGTAIAMEPGTMTEWSVAVIGAALPALAQTVDCYVGGVLVGTIVIPASSAANTVITQTLNVNIPAAAPPIVQWVVTGVAAAGHTITAGAYIKWAV